RLSAGAVVVRQGDESDGIYIVIRGDVTVEREAGAGRAVTVATLGPGQVFGEMASLTGAPRTATVSARTDLEILKLDHDGLCQIMASGAIRDRASLEHGHEPEPLPGNVQNDWTKAVRSACHALVASHHAVKSIDVLGRPTADDGPATLLQLTDLARRTA